VENYDTVLVVGLDLALTACVVLWFVHLIKKKRIRVLPEADALRIELSSVMNVPSHSSHDPPHVPHGSCAPQALRVYKLVGWLREIGDNQKYVMSGAAMSMFV
jgi:hypothetical protein